MSSVLVMQSIIAIETDVPSLVQECVTIVNKNTCDSWEPYCAIFCLATCDSMLCEENES